MWWTYPYFFTWEQYYSALEQYKAGEGNGDPNCSVNYVTKDTQPLKLGSWLSHQRMAKKGLGKGKISVERIRRLEELGVWWGQPDRYTWEKNFAALEQYKTGEGNGDPNCPKNYVTKDTPPLKVGIWLNTQRQAKKGIGSGKISVERILRLEELGVWWEKGNHNISWEDNFRALLQYKNGIGNGDPNCPSTYVTKDTPPLKLGSWLSIQRCVKRGTRKGDLSNERISKLEDLGVLWEQQLDSWEEHFAALEQYKAGEGNGDPNCSKKHVTKDIPPLKLGSWLRRNRQAKKGKGSSKISSEQIRRLEELGVWWEQPDTWEEYFSALERYKADEGNGDPNCLGKYVTKDTPPLKLGSWLRRQRSGKKGRKWKISVEQIRRLEELGVWWENPYTYTWGDYFSALVRYKTGEGNGDPNCSTNYVTKDTPPLKLGMWLSDRRRSKRTGKISSEQIRRLEELGIRWEQPDTWEDYFSALVRYKAGEGNGDPNCSGNYVTKDTPPLKLGMWLSHQRQANKGHRYKISNDQIQRLEKLGIWWNNARSWDDWFHTLEQYKAGEGNGDPNCSTRYVTKDRPPLKLGTWLSSQRLARKGIGTCKISIEQIRRLEELGVWWEK